MVVSAKISLMKSMGNDRMHVAYGIIRMISLHQRQFTTLQETPCSDLVPGFTEQPTLFPHDGMTRALSSMSLFRGFPVMGIAWMS